MMKGNGIRLLLAALILLSQGALAACSSMRGSKSEPVTVTFMVVSYPWLVDQGADYERLAETFHQAHPQINVQVKSVSFEDLPQGLANAGILTDPEWGVDVVATDVSHLPGLVERGLLRDLGPALEGDPALGADDFYAPALDALRWQGRLYGLPAELDPWVMFYNQDLFDDVGVPYPSGDWRWDDFLTTARALEKPGLFPFGSWGVQVTPFIYQNGGRVVGDPVAPEKPTLDDMATVEAVRWYLNLALLEGVMPTPAELTEYATGRGRQQTVFVGGDEANKLAAQAQADLEQAVTSGDVAMWMGPLSEGGGRWGRWDFRWGVAPLPAGRQAATLADVQGYFIIAHSEHFDQALQWVNYLTRQPPLYDGLPARRSVAADDAFRNQLRPQVAGGVDACLAVLESGIVLPESLDGVASRWLQGPLFAVLAGEQTVEEALEMAQQQAEEK
jgi:ABC-type glycerol-3-phosphate transport system substrate-binding protein